MGYHLVPPFIPFGYKLALGITCPITGILAVGSPFIMSIQVIYGYFFAQLTVQVERFREILLKIAEKAGTIVQHLDIDWNNGETGENMNLSKQK